MFLRGATPKIPGRPAPRRRRRAPVGTETAVPGATAFSVGAGEDRRLAGAAGDQILAFLALER